MKRGSFRELLVGPFKAAQSLSIVLFRWPWTMKLAVLVSNFALVTSSIKKRRRTAARVALRWSPKRITACCYVYWPVQSSPIPLVLCDLRSFRKQKFFFPNTNIHSYTQSRLIDGVMMSVEDLSTHRDGDAKHSYFNPALVKLFNWLHGVNNSKTNCRGELQRHVNF